MTADLRSVKNLYGLMLCIGLVQVSLYYLAGASITGSMTVAQPDSLLYCQAARRICEGHAFSFSEGLSPSSGTTSVLYPFVLAVPYALGMSGDLLFLAGFLLNASFYIVFLFGWAAVVDRLFASNASRLLAGVVIAAFGQTAFSALAQSDVGLWLAVSSLLIAALVRRNRGLFAAMLLLSPWIRPEGMMFVLAFGAVYGGVGAWRIAHSGRICELFRFEMLIAFFGVLSSVGVFVLNYMLTGALQFSSVAGKGYFVEYPLAVAIIRSSQDFLAMLKSFVLTLPSDGFREVVTAPILGGILLWIGVLHHERLQRWQCVVLLAVAMSLVSVATSGWQGTNADRYLAWIMPILLLLMVRGAMFLLEQHRGSLIGELPAFMLLIFTVCASFVALSHFHLACERMAGKVMFADRCESVMAPGATVATLGECGVAYRFSSRPVRHLYGIYDFAFAGIDTPELVDLIKRDESLRFDYWIFGENSEGAFFDPELSAVLTDGIIEGPDAVSLRKVRREVLDASSKIPLAPMERLALIARLDVGFSKDEKTAAYELRTDYCLPVPKVFASSGPCGGAMIVESGRVVFGGEEFSVPLVPGKDAHVILRTRSSASYVVRSGCAFTRRKASYGKEIRLRLQIDGMDAEIVSLALDETGFTDARFTISGSRIVKSPCRISVLGDHISCGYWFYQ